MSAGWERWILFHSSTGYHQYHILKRLSFLQCVFWQLCQRLGTWVYFWILYSISVVYVSFFAKSLPMWHHLPPGRERLSRASSGSWLKYSVVSHCFDMCFLITNDLILFSSIHFPFISKCSDLLFDHLFAMLSTKARVFLHATQVLYH